MNGIDVADRLRKCAECQPCSGVDALRIPPAGPVVYGLVKGDEIIYVGQTFDLICRLGQHRADKEFDEVVYVRVPQRYMYSAERETISILRPALNGPTPVRHSTCRRPRCRTQPESREFPFWLTRNGAYWRAMTVLPDGTKPSKSFGRIDAAARDTAFRRALSWAERIQSSFQKEGALTCS